VAATRDNGARHTWRRRLHGLRMERRWREVDSASARWRAVNEPPWCRHALGGTRGHGPSWAAGKRALPQIFSFQNFKIITNFVIEIGNFPMSKMH
jgi:hypothetical protein